MFDDFAPRLAHILTAYSIPVQPGDYVGIMVSAKAEPFALALYEAVLRRGGHPHLRAALPGAREIFYELANDDQLQFLDPLTMEFIQRINVLYSVTAPTNTKALSGVDPARLALAQKAGRPFMEVYFKRIEDKSLRWNITAWPTQAAAQEAEMGLRAYTEFVYNACRLNEADPIAVWEETKAQQEKLITWLNGKKKAVVKGPGIDLTFSFDGRLWVNCWGDNNFPDGEIFTSPIEDSVNGHVEFNFPTMYGGREINGVKLTFKDGKVVEASAAKGEDYLLSQLDMDEGARFLGEFAIGTNYGIQRFTGSTLFDEKIGGTVHMALGQGFEEANGVNKSQVHWDMVHDMQDGGQILIDDTLFYENGQFVIEG